MVPLAVLVPTLALLTCELVLDLAPDFVRRHSSIEHKDVFGIERVRARVQKEDTNSEGSRRRKELDVIAWLLLMLVVIYVFGLLAALPLFSFLYLKVRAKESWVLSMCVAGAMLGFLYGVFVAALNIPMYDGRLWSWLGV